MLKHFIKHLIHNLFLVLIAVVVMWTAIDIVLFIINDQRMGFVTYCTFIVVIAVMSISYTQARSDSKDP